MQVAFNIDLEVLPQAVWWYAQGRCRLMATRGTEYKDVRLSNMGADFSEDRFESIGVIDGSGKGVDFGGGVFMRDVLLGFLQ